MPIKRKRGKTTAKKIQRGTVGNFFVFGVVALLLVLGITAVGGLPPQSYPNTGQVVNIITPTQGPNYNNLQLKTFGYASTVTIPALCKSKAVNNEPEILVGYQPAPGQAVSASGQIKVWVNDEGAPFIAPGENVNLTTGQVISPGNRAAKASDGYLYEPALYIAPYTAESGGNAHFPDFIKGQFNNNPPNDKVVNGAPYDTIPPGSNPPGGPNPNGNRPNQYTAEYIWNVANLGLTTGTYEAEFLIHDGDRDRGVGCVTIQIQ